MSEKENNPLYNKPNDFGLPGGYFQRSAQAIMDKIEWQEEHKAYPFLSAHKNTAAFTVPVNYFEQSESALELLDMPQLAALKKHNPFAVPAAYFEEAETAIFAAGLLPDGNELQAFKKLGALSKQNNFKTADNYFDDNTAKLAALLAAKKPAKVIKQLPPVRAIYAAAALLVIALGFWAYSAYVKPAALAEEDCGTIACIDRVDLVKTKTLESLDNEELYEIVNTKKLEEHLNAGDKNETIKTDSAKDEALDDLLDDI